jgi:hypothetical protein
MGSSGFCRRHRSHAIVVEVLEGRALLSTLAHPPTLQIQPMGVQAVSRNSAAQAQATQNRNANAGDAVHVGAQYSKAVFSSTTGTVISNYTKALLTGNGKKLTKLGNSSAVKQLGTNFKNVANSTQAQSINHSFKKLGHSIANDFHKIFG